MKHTKAHQAKRRPEINITAVSMLVLLFAAGALHWILFLHNGDLSFKAHDWGKEFIYYSLFRQSLTTGQIPFHISLAFHGTQRFLALPETNLSPQILLLPFMSVGRFVLVNTLILYSIGFVGCLLIRQRYHLSLIPFTVLFLLFNFNGHITTHIGVGHSMWASYFLLPFYFLFVLELTGSGPRRTTPIKLAFVLFGILLQGGFHIFVWCITFLVLVLVFNWRYLKPVVSAIIFTVLMSSFRLIPATFALMGKKEKFIWSYPTIHDMLDALITIRQQTPDRLRPWGTPGWWELDVYIGIIGLALAVYFGVCLRFSRRPDLQDLRYPSLDLPIFVMGLFSVSYFHAFLTRLPIPLLKSERVATRFIIIPILLLVFLSSLRLDRVLRSIKQTLRFRFIAISAILVMALGFVDHSFLWSVVRLERIYKDRVVDLTVPGIISRPDAFYKNLVWISAGISIAAIATLFYFGLRVRTDST